jgi:ABC-2 type transport system permease protein
MLSRARVSALFGKELLDLVRNRAALLPFLTVTAIALALPFTIAIVVPAVSGERLGADADLVRVSRVTTGGGALGADARVQVFLLEQFLLLLLLMPITGAMAIAAHAIVGEKQARTLEPLLATPVTTAELVVGKVLGTLVPTLAISAAGLVVYFAGIAAFAQAGVVGAMMTPRAAMFVLVIGPLSALLSLQFAIVVSSRVSDARTAQQFGVLIVLPLTAVLLGQFSGAVWLSTSTLAVIAVVMLVLWGVLAWVTVALFDREAILTTWR